MDNLANGKLFRVVRRKGPIKFLAAKVEGISQEDIPVSDIWRAFTEMMTLLVVLHPSEIKPSWRRLFYGTEE